MYSIFLAEKNETEAHNQQYLSPWESLSLYSISSLNSLILREESRRKFWNYIFEFLPKCKSKVDCKLADGNAFTHHLLLGLWCSLLRSFFLRNLAHQWLHTQLLEPSSDVISSKNPYLIPLGSCRFLVLLEHMCTTCFSF